MLPSIAAKRRELPFVFNLMLNNGIVLDFVILFTMYFYVLKDVLRVRGPFLFDWTFTEVLWSLPQQSLHGTSERRFLK